jgi:hypothetical protein
MWAAVFGVALMGALNPVRLSAVLLVVSRARSAQNLVAFWLGALIVAVPAILIPVFALHDVAFVESVVHRLNTSTAARRVQLGAGVLFLSMAAVVLVNIVRRPARQSAMHAPEAARRFLSRARGAWEHGSLWVAVVIGMISAPAPDAVLMVLAVILTSGAAIGMQVTAGITYVLAMLVVVETVLVSYLIAPAKTERALHRVHDWVLAHRRQVLTAVLTMVGLGLTLTGLGVA